MTQIRYTTHPPSIITLRSFLAGGVRGYCAKWRLRRQCEARARELEMVLREMDPRLARDIGFDLMASRRGHDGAAEGCALIQAASTVFTEESSDQG
ncbi:MAG: hypothetical protein JNJ53_10910 [Rhizobiales bacterium]|nr:hypothetical protein [Hyphomicrobiales bacterium]